VNWAGTLGALQAHASDTATVASKKTKTNKSSGTDVDTKR